TRTSWNSRRPALESAAAAAGLISLRLGTGSAACWSISWWLTDPDGAELDLVVAPDGPVHVLLRTVDRARRPAADEVVRVRELLADLVQQRLAGLVVNRHGGLAQVLPEQRELVLGELADRRAGRRALRVRRQRVPGLRPRAVEHDGGRVLLAGVQHV